MPHIIQPDPAASAQARARLHRNTPHPEHVRHHRHTPAWQAAVLRLLWWEPLWIALVSPALLVPGRLWAPDLQPLWVLLLFAFWPLRLLLALRQRFGAVPAALRRTPLDLALFALLVATAIALARSPAPAASSAAAGYLLLGPVAAAALIQWPPLHARPAGAAWLLLAGGGAVALVGPLLLDVSNDKLGLGRPLVHTGALSHAFEETVNPNVLGGALVAPMLLALALALGPRWSQQPWRPVWGAFALFLAAELLLTQCRGAWLGAAAGAITLVLLRITQAGPSSPRSPRLRRLILLKRSSGAVLGATVLSVLGLIALPLAADRAGTLAALLDGQAEVPVSNVLPAGRLQIWQTTLSALARHPDQGLGLGLFGPWATQHELLAAPTVPQTHAHNLLLQVTADLGVPGLVAYVAILLTTAAMLAARLRRHPPHRRRQAHSPDPPAASRYQARLHWTLALGCAAALSGVLVHGMVDAALWGNKTAAIPWLLTSLACLLFLDEESDRDVAARPLRPAASAELLRRAPLPLDVGALCEIFQGKRVLVTGGGGSIGSEICRQLLRCRPAELVVLGHGENSVFEICQELQWALPPADALADAQGEPPTRIRAAIVDMRFGERILAEFRALRPQIVIHAAAHKHVPLMEEHPIEAVTNNVFGTANVVAAAQAVGVERFVLVSTDKAVRPTSIMGATKRVAELLVRGAAQQTGRPYVVVRFGNVLGSRGSVVLTFQRQILRGGPVTITDPEMRRFFMTIPEAAQFALHAAALGAGGEVFVLDMGEPVKIVDLARDLITQAGLQAGRDVAIVFNGMRPGEKLSEELFVPGEQYAPTAHPRIFSTGCCSHLRPEDLDAALAALAKAAQTGDRAAVICALQHLVPDYQVPNPIPPAHLAHTPRCSSYLYPLKELP